MFDIQVTSKETGENLHPNELGGDGFGILDTGELIIYIFPEECERLDMDKYNTFVSVGSNVRNSLIDDLNNVRAIK